MGIKDRSDVNKSISTVGKISLGTKPQPGSNYPKETPDFVLDECYEKEDQRGNVIKDPKTKKPKVFINDDVVLAIQKLGTNRPETLRIIFPLDPIDSGDLLISSYMKWWGAGNLKCVGDGEYAHFKGKENVPGLNDQSIPPDATLTTLKWKANRLCNADLCPQAVSGACKPNTRMSFIAKDISDMKMFKLGSTSMQVVESIYTDLKVLKQQLLMRNVKSLAGIPLVLYREPRNNLKGGKNYIVKLKFDERTFDEQVLLHRETGNSLLSYGDASHVQIEMAREDEPDFDLIPQNMHGRAQTGDLKGPAIEMIAGTGTPEQWIEEADVKERFAGLAALLGTQVTKPKMLARAKKYKVKQELVAYLDTQLANGK